MVGAEGDAEDGDVAAPEPFPFTGEGALKLVFALIEECCDLEPRGGECHAFGRGKRRGFPHGFGDVREGTGGEGEEAGQPQRRPPSSSHPLPPLILCPPCGAEDGADGQSRSSRGC